MSCLSENCLAIVLAGGKGTRMHSSKPKVMQTLLNEPMLAWVVHALLPIFEKNIIAVAGHKAEMVESFFPNLAFVRQNSQLGTGDALKTVINAKADVLPPNLLVINGDAPLITEETLRSFLKKAAGYDLAFATLALPDSKTYGRICKKNGKPLAIIEAKDLEETLKNNSAKLTITTDVNAGLYYMKTELAKKLLPLVTNNNSSREYYLTDIVSLAADAGYAIADINCGDDPSLLGVNSPKELADAENILANRQTELFMEKGVIIHAPGLVHIGPFVQIDKGAEIFGPAEIYGSSIIESNVKIESHCIINNCKIAENVVIHSFSHLEDAIISKNAAIGPYTRLRPGAILKEGAHAGNFVELKKTVLGENSKANHLSYLGDAEIGQNVNIGAGTITCNYDGKNKHQTKIGADSFVGSNTAIVAPINIGNGALIGAGSTITQNVKDNELAIARSRQKNLPRKFK